MADTNIIGSLFGVSPDLLQTQQDQRAFAQGMSAGSNPLGGVLGNIGMFSSRAGAGLRGALGVQNPEEQMNAIRQQASTQFNTATPEGMLQYAQFLNQQGDAAGAQQAVIRAQAMAKEAQAIATSRAQQIRAEREPGQLNFQQLLSSGKYTPASVAKFQQSQNPADLILAKEATGAGGLPKPLPASLQKDEGKDLEAYDSYAAQKEALMPSIVNLTPDAEGVRKLQLGPLKNAEYIARNLAGNSSPESRAYEGLKSAVDTAVNLQVSAEKGVQTDKDVLRFANALIAAYGRNDTQATLEALTRYYDSVNRAQQKTAGRIESRRKSQNVEPYFQGQPAQPQTPTTAPKEISFDSLPKRKP
jgi:hypothetical protein